MLAVEDCLDSLKWAESVGGLQGLIARANANLSAIEGWVEKTDWVRFLAKDIATRSCTSICLELPNDTEAAPKRIAQLLDDEGAAYDIDGYRDAPPSLRIWGGATVETADIEALLPWLDWAHDESSQPTAAR
jgi:phosphoserine aminotransferase